LKLTNFEKLTELCIKQNRGLYLSASPNYVNIIITEPSSLEAIAYLEGSNDSINYTASILLDQLIKDSKKIKLEVVK